MILSQLGPNLRALSDRRLVALYTRGKCRVYEDYAKPRRLATGAQVSDLQGRGFA